MMKSGTLTALQSNGTWESQHGTLYQFEVQITMPDGSKITGECNSKSQEPPYAEGEQVWYEVTRETQYGKKLKVRNSPPYEGRPQGGGQMSSAVQDKIGNQWAIRDAIQVLISRGDEVTYLNISDTARELCKMRDNLAQYMMSDQSQNPF